MPAKATPLPDPHDWDFRSVPEVEVPIALVYECARSVDWIRADWQVFLDTKIPNWKIHRDKGGAEFVWGNKETTTGATLNAGRFPKLRAHRETLWQFMCGFIPQRLSASWFVEVLKLVPQFPTPWLTIPPRLRTSIAKQYGFSGDDPYGFSVFAPGEPVAPRIMPFEFFENSFQDVPAFVEKLKQPKRIVDGWLRHQLTLTTNLMLAFYERTWLDVTPLTSSIARDLNRLIKGPLIYRERIFSGVSLRKETQELMSLQPKGETLARLNRLLLEDAYPLEIVRRASAKSKVAKPAHDNSYFTVRINWSRNQVQILSGFENWLACEFEQRGIETDRAKCGQASASHFTKLNWLGQMRLLDAVGFTDASAALDRRNRAPQMAVADRHMLDVCVSQPSMSRNKKKISDLIKLWFPEPQPALKFPWAGYVPILTTN